jgi:23S rRNA (uracil1939-C5)-methyltransferase
MASELRAERIAAGGDAIAREPDGRVVFVPGALPGELVRVTLVEERTDFARASLDEVLEPSPDRVGPPCPFVAQGCGGCSWQHIRPEAQPTLKVAIVAEALARTGGLRDAVVVAGPALATTGFRTTLRLAVDARGRTGFRAARSHDVVAVGPCLVAHPRLNELLDVEFPGAREVTLRCGAATGDRSAATDPAGAVLEARLPTDVATGRRAAIREVVEGVELHVSTGSFFQTRADGAAALVQAVAHAADGHVGAGPMVDAYAGVGLFAVTLGAGVSVTAVEWSRSSCADARHNLAGRDAHVIEVDVERWRPHSAGLVVADPSRRGLGARAAAVLAATLAPRLVLVSCDAASLARDTKLLAGHGYRHAGSTVLDLFPHTPHVEVVTRFDRA